mgnify:CR=1 FL=1
MSESKENRWFYNCDEDFIKQYKVKEKNHIKIITRLNPDFPQNINLFRKLFPNCKMAKRFRKDTDNENVIKYKWDLTPYDNSGYGDEYNYISFIITNDLNVLEIVKSNFDNVSVRKSSNFTYTLKINCNVSPRGIWKYEKHPHLLAGNSFNTFYPICILSFGRYNDNGRTHKLLTKLQIKHSLYVEPFEYELYKEWYDPKHCNLVKAPEDFHLKNMGSTPMRNYILDDNEYSNRIWLLDDNIKCYKRLFKGVKNTIESPEIFTSIEEYINRYDNVGIVSHNFNPFVVEGGCRSIMCKNGKCYSSMLVPTDPEIRFKHKHQEDNFISIEYINKGYTNLCFNHIIYDKNTSGDDGGGNTKHIYKKDEEDIGRKERYDYSFKTAETLINSGEIKLKKGTSLENFVFHKPLKHEHYHVEFNYQVLENYDKNDIILKDKHTWIEERPDSLYLDTNETEEINVIKDDERTKLMKLTKEELVDLILNKN